MNNTNKIFSRRLDLSHFLFIILLPLFFINCGTQKNASEKTRNNYNERRVLLRDEGMSQLSYLDMANPANNWYLPIPTGRDIQLVGNSRVLIGTDQGYEEREIASGKKIVELNSYPGTIAARRLRNGNTLLTGVNWQGKKGIVLVEVDAAGTIHRLINYTGFDYVRLVRQTSSGNFLVTADNKIFEGNNEGNIVWQVKINGIDHPHAWQALRLANGKTIVSSGYGKNFQFFTADGKLTDSISGPAEVKPNFYSGFQILKNGNYVVANWEGHGPKFGAIGTQLLEYTPDGKLAWSWKQDATKFSSLQAVIVLDGLDLNYLHIEDANGVLAPVKIINAKN